MSNNNIKENTKKNDRIGIMVSLGVHSLLLILLLFVIAWRQPDPPTPGLPGIEINIGFVEDGMGDVNNNTEPVVEETPVEEIQPEEVQPEDVVQEVVTTNNVESPHVVEKVEKKTEVKKEVVEKKDEKKPVETKNLMSNNKDQSDGDKNSKGNQGDPEGNPDSRNLYPGNKGNGNNGGGGNGTGASLDLPGWQWDTKPNKIDPTSESGYVLFEFYVDEDGTVTSAKKIGGANLTPSEDNFYKKQLLETSFSLKDPKAKPAPKTRGIFRFDVKSR